MGARDRIWSLASLPLMGCTSIPTDMRIEESELRDFRKLLGKRLLPGGTAKDRCTP